MVELICENLISEKNEIFHSLIVPKNVENVKRGKHPIS